MADKKKHDFLIVGCGFSGALTAMGLTKLGYDVIVVERESHPRFSIGESSTPIADMLLRSIAEEYELEWLKSLSRYGSWQENHSQIGCGIKRGFSYYFHQPNQPFEDTDTHENELMVAASVDNENSDTNWYRPDLDTFLTQKMVDLGVKYVDNTEIKKVNRKDSQFWSVETVNNKSSEKVVVETTFIIDATGSPRFSGMMFNTNSTHANFETNSSALFSHFDGVLKWNDLLKLNGRCTSHQRPYNPDLSALHHIIEEGWMWMLRFNTEKVSAGIVFDGGVPAGNPENVWQNALSKYPSVNKLFATSEISELPGKLYKTERLQRVLDRLQGRGWLALHHTAGFVDPLHSTGIAHSLIGVQRVLKIFKDHKPSDTDVMDQLKEFESLFKKELKMIDLLVAGCYRFRFNPDLFRAYTMLYFVCSIYFEQTYLSGQTPKGFLGADHENLFRLVNSVYSDSLRLDNKSDYEAVQLFVESVKRRIEPYNSVGLMNPLNKNLYHHTAVEM